MIHLLDDGHIKAVKKKNLLNISGGYIIINISTTFISNVYTIVKVKKLIRNIKPVEIIIDIGLCNNECGVDIVTIHSEQTINDYNGYYSIDPLQCLMDNISESVAYLSEIYIDEPYLKNFILRDKDREISLMSDKILKKLNIKTHVADFNEMDFIVMTGNKWTGYSTDSELPFDFDYILIKYPSFEHVHILSREEYYIFYYITNFTINILSVEKDLDGTLLPNTNIGSYEGNEVIEILPICIATPDIIRIFTIVNGMISVEIEFLYKGSLHKNDFMLNYGETINIYNMIMQSILKEGGLYEESL